jgi:hypothetical protein
MWSSFLILRFDFFGNTSEETLFFYAWKNFACLFAGGSLLTPAAILSWSLEVPKLIFVRVAFAALWLVSAFFSLPGQIGCNIDCRFNMTFTHLLLC